jgi:uncharacterized protein YndB with AHSA1/START domain
VEVLDMEKNNDLNIKLSFPSEKELLITSIINAPRELTFSTMTNPKYITKWWGPKKVTTTIDQMEFKPKGMWRFIETDHSGNIYAFNGIYDEIIENEKIMYTYEFENMLGHILVETITLEDNKNKTKINDKVHFHNVLDRNYLLKYGFDKWTLESMEKLTNLVETLKN